MIGYLRFFLALFIFSAHTLPEPTSEQPQFYRIGVSCILMFYFLSGQLMERSYGRFLDKTEKPIRSFLGDRFLRMFPQYILVVLITILSISIFGKSTINFFFNQDLNAFKIVLNLFLIPVNYIFHPLQIKELLPHPFIPPAWSLATEFQFYLILPFIYKFKKPYFLILNILCLGILVSSFFIGSENFNPQSMGYRLPFGVLSFFFFGMCFSRKDDPFYFNLMLFNWFTFSFMLFIMGPIFGFVEYKSSIEILFGGFIALPIAFLVENVKIKKEYFKKLGYLLSELAYPTFLVHYLSFFLLEKIFNILPHNRTLFVLGSLVISLSMAYLLSIYQRKFETIRFKRRGFESLRKKI